MRLGGIAGCGCFFSPRGAPAPSNVVGWPNAGQPLLNVHDIVVHQDFRRQGIARALLGHAEAVARQRGCCKLTLEVLEGNHGARRAYLDFGFEGYQLDPAMGQALFMEKKLG